MNLRNIIRQLGVLLVVVGVALLAIAGFSAVRLALGDADERAALIGLLSGGVIGGAAGSVIWGVLRRAPAPLRRREAMLLVTLSWVLTAALSAAPYAIWAQLDGPADHPFRNLVDCYFESMSGLTTTGSTVLADVESLPRSLLLWRATTHWLGGLGIIVLFVAILPSLGVGGRRLYRVEAPGPEAGGVQPHIRQTARVLWLIYSGFTLAEIVALRLTGMDWFDATCHALATLATGGFSTHNASVAALTPAAEIVIIVFMVLAGINFGLYHQLIKRRIGVVLRDPELRLYLIMLALATVVITLLLVGRRVTSTTGDVTGSDTGVALREAAFTVVSIQTTTGFCTADFNLWPSLAQGVLIVLMFVGGCAGSTSGGIKVIRVWIALRVMASEIERAFRPHVVRPLRVSGATIDTDLKLGTVAYVLGIVVLFALGTGALLSLERGLDFASASTASLASICTIGPGLGRVGASENYGWMTGSSKMVLTSLMLMGRLEVFAVLALFVPSFWRAE